ncbi:MAG: adenylate/guanylate cyclase domain-containing protein [Rickettsiales bacterium]|nr:adenylate/guanylate cyclase domain-containing protein [Rickettsiales bacterium]
MPEIQRRLATILATDCVGYSALMVEDETATLDGVKACRTIIETTINEYGGRVFNTAGDSVIAEFNSPVDCVNAAIDFQNLLFDRNKTNKNIPTMQFRVGIHLDDVIIEDGDIFGNGVNIAARLEGVCDPGEILISENVHQYISKKINLISEHIGNKNLKNIDGEFPVFQINIQGDNLKHSDYPNVIKANNSKIRLLVLPFRNSNNSQDNSDLVDGIVEDLITEFSLIKDIEVMSNATTTSIKDNAIDLSLLRENYGADFFLTGSIRSSGNRVRVSVELLSSDNADVLWKERYDREIEDLFDVQDDIVRSVMFPLVGEIEFSTLDRAERKPTQNLSSYEYLLKGKVLHHKYKKDTHPIALEYFNKSIELDPENGAAYAWKACTVGGGISRGFFEESEDISKNDVLECINKALEINQNDFECYRMLSRVHLTIYGDHKKAIEFGKKATDLNPNDPRILWAYGTALALSGLGRESLSMLIKSYNLSPNLGVEGSVDNIISSIIVGYYISEEYEKSIDWFEKLEIRDFRSYVLCIIAFVKTGKDIYFLDDFLKDFGEVDYIREIELFKFKDHNITNYLKKTINQFLK